MNPADVVKNALNSHFNETRFNARFISNDSVHVLEVKFADKRYHRSVHFPRDMSRREIADTMIEFIVTDFATTQQGKRNTNEANRASSR